MENTNKNAPAGRTGAKSETSEGERLEHYTPNPEEAKRALALYLSALPADLRAKMEKFNSHILNEALSVGNSSPEIESLLPPLKTVDAALILKTEYPPIDWIVPEYLAPGLTFLVGKPKVGKSWLALQLANSVLTGGKMFGKDVKPGRVLILALEDNERRLNDRMKKQNWNVSPGSVDFMMSDAFMDQITALNAGGGKRLLKFIEKNRYRVVIVDTFSRAIQGDQLDAGEMTEAIGPLQQYALNKGVALVIIDHMPKNAPTQNPIDHIYGSVGKAGVTDSLWGLYKEQGRAGAKLAITGRDVAETELKLVFDLRGFYWHCEGVASDVELTAKRKAILDALRDLGRANLKEIAEVTGQDKSNCHGRLQDLVNDGKIRRISLAQTSEVYYELVTQL
ncbi:MAG: hypothetical protein DDG60_00755 [Anaerolineae bacterium]|nr:MAG: hypothetical protein DDG60_00755 [Anaerolineae bacterium]